MHSPPESDAFFYDDFGLGQLDRSKWSVRTTGRVVNDEQQAYVDSPETIYAEPGVDGADGNALALHPRYRPGFETSDGRRFDFISGRIDTRETFRFRYGSAAARIKLPVGPGVWPAFWMLGDAPWPGSGEIDVMEYVGDSDWTSCAIHGPDYSGEAGLVNKRFFSGGGDAAGWHIYAVDWAPDAIVFRIDGTVVYRVTRPMVEFFGEWVFDNEKFLVLNCALGGTYPFKTNGIRSPYYGIADETVGKIREDQARVLVDWVRVVELTGETA
jgi:beta-glucanase (GH16 family)